MQFRAAFSKQSDLYCINSVMYVCFKETSYMTDICSSVAAPGGGVKML